MFKDRNDAAMQLAKKLDKYKNQNAIVLAIPRGGVPIGYTIAKELGLPMEIVLSKKIGHPQNPEYAIGSVSLQGAIINDDTSGIPQQYIDNETKRILKELEEKFKLFMGDHKPADLNNKIVIIVDDGIATGSTILATVDTIKKNNPQKIIIAVPVAPPSAALKLEKNVNEFVCLLTPLLFRGVGQFYHDFSQVSDDEVIQLLRDIKKNQTV